jgi:hypothetical protein
MPFSPLITGSSPRWIHIEAIFIPASVLQYPLPPLNLFILHSLGHKVQFSSIIRSSSSKRSFSFTVEMKILKEIYDKG